MKVIVTASRDWVKPTLIEAALVKCWHWAGAAEEGLEVVHGDARGGDLIAKLWALRIHAQDRRVDHKPYPANWSQGLAAGNRRNTFMVDQNYDADLCIAFPRVTSVGTPDCAQKCRDRGIPVWLVNWTCSVLPAPPPARLVPDWEQDNS
jgi:hypothetical protein